MYITHSLVAIKKGAQNYLFFYITEEYIEEQAILNKQITPLLEEFARNLKDKGVVVKSFKKDIENINHEIKNKFDQHFTYNEITSIHHESSRPGLLIINADFEEFNPKNDPWIYVSFKSYLRNTGHIDVVEIHEFLAYLTSLANSELDLFEEVNKRLDKEKIRRAYDAIELKPEIFGISIDLKRAIKFFQ
jgi:hypothetical protein